MAIFLRYEEIRYLQDVMKVVVWFLVMNSVVVHGLVLPVAKLCCWILYKARKFRRLDASSNSDGRALEDTKIFRDWFVRKFSSRRTQMRFWSVGPGYGTIAEA